MKKILIILVLMLTLCGCSNDSNNIKKLMEENEHVIIDVRTKEEYDDSHIKKSINIPYDQINENININKNKIIFVYCASGKRSEIAFRKLKSYGYEVYDLGAFRKIDLEKE